MLLAENANPGALTNLNILSTKLKTQIIFYLFMKNVNSKVHIDSTFKSIDFNFISNEIPYYPIQLISLLLIEDLKI